MIQIKILKKTNKKVPEEMPNSAKISANIIPLIALFLVIGTVHVSADTQATSNIYYVATTGNDTNHGTRGK